LKQQGFEIAQRTAGSHSPIDIIAIDPINKRIKLIQCKPDSMSDNNKDRIILNNIKLNGLYTTTFNIM
jgi:hypothetical protein